MKESGWCFFLQYFKIFLLYFLLFLFALLIKRCPMQFLFSFCCRQGIFPPSVFFKMFKMPLVFFNWIWYVQASTVWCLPCLAFSKIPRNEALCLSLILETTQPLLEYSKCRYFSCSHLLLLLLVFQLHVWKTFWGSYMVFG